MTIAAILGDKGREVVTIDCGARIGEAVALLATRRIGALPVMKDGVVVGVFSERDVIQCLQAHGDKAIGLTVDSGMTSPVVTVEPGDAVLSALSLMTARRFRHLPVVEGGKLVGLVSIGDLVKHRIDNIEREAAALRDYITSA